MSPSQPNDPVTGDRRFPGPAIFDHEKLHVYQLQLRFIAWVTPLIEEARTISIPKTREVCDQLDRASLSSVLNTAEGNGKRQRQVRAKFFDDARGSATESAGCLDALVAKPIFTRDRIVEGKLMLLRIVSMLCKLVDRFDEAGDQLHEPSSEYRIGPKAPTAPRTRTRTRTKRNRMV